MFAKQPATSRPIATCIAENCTGCPVKGAVHCHFSLKDLAHFVLVAVPSFLLGAEGISRLGEWYLVPWLVFIG